MSAVKSLLAVLRPPDDAPAPRGMDRPAIAAVVLALGIAPLLALLITDRASMVALGVAALGVGLFLLSRPHLVMYLLVGGTIFNRFFVDAGFALLGAGDLAVLVVLPVWMARRVFYPTDWQIPRGWPLLAAYMAISAASLVLGTDPAAGQTAYVREVTYVAALLAGVDLTRDTARLRSLFVLMCWCGLLLVVHAILTWPGGRMEGLIGQPNGLAFILSFCLWPTLGLAMSAPPSLGRMFYFGAFSLMVIGVVLTISRSNYLGLGFAGLWWLRNNRRLIVLAGLIGLAIGAVLAINPEATSEIFERWKLEDRSVSQRLQERDNAARAVEHSPWLGVGFGQFEQVHNEVDITSEHGRAAHNQYVALPAEVGIPGALALFGFVFVQFLALWGRGGLVQQLLPDERWMLAVLQALAIHQSVTLMFRNAWRQPEWTVLFFYCALVAILGHRARRAANAPVLPVPVESA